MPNYTPNYNLKKPLTTESYNVEDQNANMDLIDAALQGKVSQSLATAENDFLVASGPGAFVKKTLAQIKTILGLGDAAYKNTGTTTGTVATGNHTHSAYIPHSLATAVNDFLVASGGGAFIKKTLAEVKTILGLGSAAYTNSTAYATAAQGVKADAALPAASYTAADVLAKVKTVDVDNSGLNANTLQGIQRTDLRVLNNDVVGANLFPTADTPDIGALTPGVWYTFFTYNITRTHDMRMINLAGMIMGNNSSGKSYRIYFNGILVAENLAGGSFSYPAEVLSYAENSTIVIRIDGKSDAAQTQGYVNNLNIRQNSVTLIG